MKARLQNHSLSFHKPPCFIGLWSIYNDALILLPWAFIRMYLEIFNPFVSNMGLQCIYHLWALLFHFIIIILFFFSFFFLFFLSSPLTRIYFSLPFKVHEVLFILGLGNKEA